MSFNKHFNPPTYLQVHPLARFLSRRDLLKLGTYLLIWFSVSPSKQSSTESNQQSVAQPHGYGMGTYGKGEYPGNKNIYLTLV